WQLVNGVLSVPAAQPPNRSRIRIPVTPGEEYDLKIVGTREQGEDALGVGLALPKSQAMVNADGWPKEDHLSGLAWIDGKSLDKNGTACKGAMIENSKPFELICSVRKGRIRAWLDGRNIVDWSDDLARLSILDTHGVPDKRSLFLLTSWSAFRITQIAFKGTTASAGPSPLVGSPPKFKNGLGMEFAKVPKGKFWRNGGNGVAGQDLQEMPYDYYIGVYEVTQGEWEKIMGANPSQHRNAPGEDPKRLPVDNIQRPQLHDFMSKLNDRDKNPGWVYRLPTPTEWEYACRGGPMTDPKESSFNYYFKDGNVNELKPDQANFLGSGKNGTVVVGKYKPNKLGLYDMHGNVSEWCENANGSTIARGGSYAENALNCRAGVRGGGRVNRGSTPHGLRVVCVPVGAVPTGPAEMPDEERGEGPMPETETTMVAAGASPFDQLRRENIPPETATDVFGDPDKIPAEVVGLVVLARGTGTLHHPAVSPDCSRLALSGSKYPTSIWRVPDLKHLGGLPKSHDVVGKVFLSDNKRLAGVNVDGDLSIWDTAQLKLEHQEPPPAGFNSNNCVSALSWAVRPDRKQMAIGYRTGLIQLRSTESGTEEGRFRVGGFACCVAYSPDGGRVAVDFFPEMKAHQVTIHDVTANKDDALGSIHGLYRAHDYFAFSPNGKALLYGDSYIKDVNRLDLESRKEHNIVASSEPNAGIAAACDGKQIATVSAAGKVRLWTGAPKQIAREIALPALKGKTWWCADFVVNDRYLIVTDMLGGRVYILRLQQ
ncbi:MAG TPA: SUMF1/EgtB/PvdO family nonheme iron enzyme, partial [Gemmataceae bacterium]|nr:SUMF1/EgtB/PvdO family nonheme iron enzyme [Gemmataceae bacterium]